MSSTSQLLRSMRYYLRVLRELFFPRRCAVCGKTIDMGYLCEVCRKSYLLQKHFTYTPREEFLAGAAEPLPEDVLTSVTLLYKYEGELKEAMHQLKFAAAADLLPLLREEAESALPPAKLRWLAQYDLISCVPTSSERREQRGFDVPEEIFAPLLDERGGQYYSGLLRRVRSTQPLFALPRQERRAELAGCFALHPKAQVSRKKVLLCDDIYTSGSTMAEAAKVLLAAGAREVHVLAFTGVSTHWQENAFR